MKTQLLTCKARWRIQSTMMGAVYSLCFQLSCGLCCLGDKKRAHVVSSSWPARVSCCRSFFPCLSFCCGAICFNKRRKWVAAAVFLSGPSLMHRESGTRTWQWLPLIKHDCCLIANSDVHSPNKITFVISRWLKSWVYERKSLACAAAGEPFVRQPQHAYSLWLVNTDALILPPPRLCFTLCKRVCLYDW